MTMWGCNEITRINHYQFASYKEVAVKYNSNHSWSINDCGDVISVETFISCPEALSIEEQQVLMEISSLLARLTAHSPAEECLED